MRFAFQNRGKSGSSRVLYVDFVVAETIYLIFAYPKNEKDNLTDEERNNIKKLIDRLEAKFIGGVFMKVYDGIMPDGPARRILSMLKADPALPQRFNIIVK